MSDLRVELRMNAPASIIWQLWEDVANAPQWDTDVRQCTLDGPFRVGTQGLCVLKNGLKMPLQITQVSPLRSYTNIARLLGMHLTFSHYLTPIGAQTHVVHAVRIEGRLSFLYRGLVRRLLQGAMGQALRNLRGLAEARAAQDASESLRASC